MITDERITTLIDLMRHGESVGGSRYRGQMDDPLSDTGWAQMRAAIGGARPWDVIFSSPLSRCFDFAEELSARSGIPLEVDERLKEIGFGVWQGKTREEITQYDPGLLQRFYRDPLTHRPDGAEGLAEFRTRIVSAWNDILARHAGRHILIVCHAGTIRMVLSHILEIPLANLFRIKVGHARITRIECAEQGEEFLGQLVFHGGTL
ncbi:histidine phosphatase family protein [Candidatus Methylocalor cossyra]|uniref:Alpha-ribazole-5'-phosphate phosphatase n=1 Tax=Candidatus Methylocalor cossyra TaxID=3108543 RepID=A0ABM9NIY2_9GAMM